MPTIYGSVTEGAADAFAEASIQTALEGQTANAYSVTAITFEFDTTHVIAGNAAPMDVELALTRRTKAAMPNITDTDVVFKWHRGALGASNIGWFGQPDLLFEYRPPSELIIVEDPIYFQIDSTATALTLTCLVAIEFEIVAISSLDRLTLLTLSL